MFKRKKDTNGQSQAPSLRARVGGALLRLFAVASREVAQLIHTPIYLFCMIVFPLLIIFFFTSLMQEGQPVNLPCGVVDNDNSTTTRALIRNLDSFQSTEVVAHYPNVNEARKAIQRNEIYAFLYIPEGTTAKLIAKRQPKISFYYSNVTLVAGSMLFKDLKTVSTLGGAAVGSAKLQMLGKTSEEIKTFLQPIALDMHLVGNPLLSYNIYLTTIMVPGILVLFIFLITVYSIGTELKFGRGKEWLEMSGNNIFIALSGKLLPQFLIFMTIFLGYEWYVYGYLNFPHPGGASKILLLGFLTVLSSQGFGTFMFGLMPSLRMSMSICSLWAVVGFSLCGATFPVFAMHPMLESFAQLIPLRHYYMVYQITVFNGYPLINAWWNVVALAAFALLPILTARNMKKAMLEYVYIP
ncbi:ABC transporter permease [Prevotella sp. HUN102]|uniref:ABC transporter permease n=1 Tax=Prevotella sp. HUN102 TaxID=1392486 RepID=UPI0009DCCAAA|nr:ABC transporter permease [Prevotella sp. HUN102]